MDKLESVKKALREDFRDWFTEFLNECDSPEELHDVLNHGLRMKEVSLAASLASIHKKLDWLINNHGPYPIC
jgi:hypothetical protein